MKNLNYLLFILLFNSCSNYEKVGNFNYKTNIERVNIGEFDALIYNYKQYVHNKDTIFSTLVKAQKLDFETTKDSIFGYGELRVEHKNNKIYILTKETYINGYQYFTEIDSVVRFYEQLKNGKVKFNKILHYRNGVVKKEYLQN
nr:hypothetical protein [uncultured Flavobacterium sp.]